MNRNTFSIASDHPCLVGHFPRNPIVPGVVVLERVIEAVSQNGVYRVIGVRRCKFVGTLRPDQVCTIQWWAQGDGFRFVCRNADRLLARGSLRVANA